MIGEQIGKWTVVKKLSRGGMADVYLAEETSPNGGRSGKVAIKILRLPEDDDQGKLLAEGEPKTILSDPALAAIYFGERAQ